MTTTITSAAVSNFWTRTMLKNIDTWIDCGEFNTTAMGEDAAVKFGVASDMGNSAIEQDIFDWAVDYSMHHTVNEFL